MLLSSDLTLLSKAYVVAAAGRTAPRQRRVPAVLVRLTQVVGNRGDTWYIELVYGRTCGWSAALPQML